MCREAWECVCVWGWGVGKGIIGVSLVTTGLRLVSPGPSNREGRVCVQLSTCSTYPGAKFVFLRFCICCICFFGPRGQGRQCWVHISMYLGGERHKNFVTHDPTTLTMTRQSHGKIAFLVLWDQLCVFDLIFPVTLVGHGQGHWSKSFFCWAPPIRVAKLPEELHLTNKLENSNMNWKSKWALEKGYRGKGISKQLHRHVLVRDIHF